MVPLVNTIEGFNQQLEALRNRLGPSAAPIPYRLMLQPAAIWLRTAKAFIGDGFDEDAVRQSLDRYRGQLLEQMLKLVIANAPGWFACDEDAPFEAFPTSAVTH